MKSSSGVLGGHWILATSALALCAGITFGTRTQPAQVRASDRAEPATRLVQTSRPGRASRYLIELKAQGQLTPAKLPDAPEPPPVPLRVESRFDFYDRLQLTDPEKTPTRAWRYVRQAAVAINSPSRPLTVLVRPDVSTLITRLVDGQPFTYSTGGPLTRQELDILQGPADPLLWGQFLPPTPVAAGDSWSIGPDLARSLTDYEALASNTLRAKLETLEPSEARIHLAGTVRGAVRGAEGTMSVTGDVVFNRLTQTIESVQLSRTEKREPGHVEAAFEFQGELKATRTPVAIPPELSDALVKELPTDDSPALALLRFSPPNASYRLYHDRNWHLFWEDERLAVLKRLDQGEILAQCNVSKGPNAGEGRHQQPSQFRDDIRKALGSRFAAFIGAGEVTQDTAEGFRYKVAVQGRESDRDILWYYFLLASPAGDQVLVTYTLNLADKDRLGNEDLEMVGSLEWTKPPAAAGSTTSQP